MIRQYSFSQELAFYGLITVMICLGLTLFFFKGHDLVTNQLVNVIYNCMIYIPPCIFIIGVAVGLTGSLRREMLTANLYGILFNSSMLVLHSLLIMLLKDINWLYI
ncbi:hypothetical protein [Haloplasma contractile]|uniref:Uncharacterized protein n=1 Tax=Haloplasma contractile SSD-17B TaxID=1033810 RepID=F7PU95_9MOLU|nr:hypothetical protein [Haloplasma contractile]ERJ11719.1 hypothetical protein HLPCO_002202 [Haloplasma contractile SSD-17B]